MTVLSEFVPLTAKEVDYIEYLASRGVLGLSDSDPTTLSGLFFLIENVVAVTIDYIKKQEAGETENLSPLAEAAINQMTNNRESDTENGRAYLEQDYAFMKGNIDELSN